MGSRTAWLLAALLVSTGCSPTELIDRMGAGGSGDLREGIEKFNAGDLDAARPLLEQAVASRPDDPNAQLYMALAHMKSREMQQARERLEKAQALAPENERVHFYLAELARARRDFAAAQRHLEQALELEPDSFAILNNLGLVCCERKQYKKAIGYYTRAIEKNKTSFVTFYNLGEAYRKSEQYSNAASIFEQARELEPDNIYLAFSLAETFFFLERHEEALQHYTRVLGSKTAFDQLGRVHFQIGVIHYAQGKVIEAMGYFDLASQAGYDDALVNVWKAKVQLRLGQFEQALDLLEAAEAARGGNERGNPAQIRYYRGVVQLNLGEFDAAVDSFKQALLFDLPRDRIFAQLGVAHLRQALGLPSTGMEESLQKQLEEAQENFEKCLAIDKANLVSLMGLSQVWFLLEDFETALGRANEVLTLEKDHPPALLQRSLCFQQLGRMSEAVGGLEAYLVLEPANTRVMFFLAQIYAQVGRYVDAEALFQRGLAIDPNDFDAMLLLSSVYAKTGRWKDAAIMLERILDKAADLQVKTDARELYALVSKTYREAVDRTKRGVEKNLGTAAYVEKRLAEPSELLSKAEKGPLPPAERAELQEKIDRLILDHNYLSQNNLFESDEIARRYADGLRALVNRLKQL